MQSKRGGRGIFSDYPIPRSPANTASFVWYLEQAAAKKKKAVGKKRMAHWAYKVKVNTLQREKAAEIEFLAQKYKILLQQRPVNLRYWFVTVMVRAQHQPHTSWGLQQSAGLKRNGLSPQCDSRRGKRSPLAKAFCKNSHRSSWPW